MRIHARLILSALAVVALLAAVAASASANRLSISNRFLRILFLELTFTNEASGGGSIESICPVTLEGSFHSNTIPKIRELLIGYITRAERNLAACRFTNAEGVTIDSETLPWHIRYDAFTGTLPRITAVLLRIVNVGFRMSSFGVPCVYRSTAANPARFSMLINASGQIEPLVALSESSVPIFEGGIVCTPGYLRGFGLVRLLNALLTLVFIRLI